MKMYMWNKQKSKQWFSSHQPSIITYFILLIHKLRNILHPWQEKNFIIQYIWCYIWSGKTVNINKLDIFYFFPWYNWLLIFELISGKSKSVFQQWSKKKTNQFGKYRRSKAFIFLMLSIFCCGNIVSFIRKIIDYYLRINAVSFWEQQIISTCILLVQILHLDWYSHSP